VGRVLVQWWALCIEVTHICKAADADVHVGLAGMLAQMAASSAVVWALCHAMSSATAAHMCATNVCVILHTLPAKGILKGSVQKMAFLCSAMRLAFTAMVNSIGSSADRHMHKGAGLLVTSA
jgi:uncharacterized membrane protein